MNYVIIIGCNNYPHASKKLQTLKCAENDAKELKKILEDQDRGNFGENIRLFINEPSHEIMGWIYRYLDAAMSNDTVLIYYSGHGRLDKSLGLHLCTYNTDLDSLPTTSLPAAQIKQYVNQSLSTKIVCILDCCYSGNVDKTFKGGDISAELQRCTEGKGKYIITASDKYQLAREVEGGTHSIFTKHMLEGLKGAADTTKKGRVTVEDLYTYVYEKVVAEGGQKPLKFVTQGAGDFILVEVPAAEDREERRSPYVLGRTPISFTNFLDLLEEARGTDGKINIGVVMGSGRCKVADHTSYGTDAILVPEIIDSLKDWNKDITVSSYLDIDIFGTKDIANKNLIIIGSGKVNLLTMELLAYFRRDLKVRFPFMDTGDIYSECGSGKPRRYEAEKINWGSNEGLLSLIVNPWAAVQGNKRLIILAAGSHPIGTIASMRLLNDYIKYRENRADNKHDEHVPAKIVRGIRVEEEEYSIRYPELQETPKNTPTYIGNIESYEILE